MALNIIGRDILAFILSGHRTERQTEFFTFLVLFCIYMVGFLGWVSGLGFWVGFLVFDSERSESLLLFLNIIPFVYFVSYCTIVL
mgnify:CR=1 FL=1